MSARRTPLNGDIDRNEANIELVLMVVLSYSRLQAVSIKSFSMTLNLFIDVDCKEIYLLLVGMNRFDSRGIFQLEDRVVLLSLEVLLQFVLMVSTKSV